MQPKYTFCLVNVFNSQEQHHFLCVTAFAVTEKIPTVHINVWAPLGSFFFFFFGPPEGICV